MSIREEARQDTAWQAIADALGHQGYELNSHDETRDWVERHLLGREQDTREPSDRNVSGLAGGFQSEVDSESALSMPSDAEAEAVARAFCREWPLIPMGEAIDVATNALIDAQQARRG